MIPLFPNFQALDVSMLDTLKSALTSYSPSICDLELDNIYFWEQYQHPQVTWLNSNLCILLTPEKGKPYFFEPIGNTKIAETLDACLRYCNSKALVSENFLTKLPTLDKYVIVEKPQDFDYVYLTQELALLQGTKFRTKRNHVHHFKNAYPSYKVLSITEAFATQALAFFSKWELQQDLAYQNVMSTNVLREAVRSTFIHYSYADCMGIYVVAEQQVLGYILGSPLNQNTFAIHFQFGLYEVPGIYQFMLQQMCERLYPQYLYVNLENDLGLEGLRKMKLSYHPYKIEKKYEISLSVVA